MKKLLLLLLGTALISAIAYFCFLDKVSNIKQKIISDVQKSYQEKGMGWVKVKLAGDGIYSTRNIILEGTAQTMAQKDQATKIALRDGSIFHVVNKIKVAPLDTTKEVVENLSKPAKKVTLAQTVPQGMADEKAKDLAKKEQKEEDIQKSTPQELSKQEESKIKDTKEIKDKKEKQQQKESVPLKESQLFATIDKNRNILLSGVVKNSKIHDEIVFHTKRLFEEDKIKDEIVIDNRASNIDLNSITVALDELQALDFGEFELKENNLKFSGYVNDFDKKERILSELDSFMPDTISSNYNLKSPKKVEKIADKSEEILKIAEKKAEERLKTITFDTEPKKQEESKKEQKPIIKKVQLSCQDRFKEVLAKEKIHFKYNRYDIDPSSYKLLDNLIKIAKECSGKAIEIAGHTDSDGSKEYNQRLSLNRAKEVKKYLVNHGVDEKMLVASGYGELKPITDNKTAQAKAKNRRIEFNIISTKELENLKSKLNANKEATTKTKVTKKEVAKQKHTNNITPKSKVKIMSTGYCIDQFNSLLSHKKIYFSIDKKKIAPESRSLLKKLSNIAKSCPNATIFIDAYTDSIGSKKKNLALSQTKANTVKRFMVNMGIDPKRIKAIGHGEADPIANNDTILGRSKNRRVEFHIKGSK